MDKGDMILVYKILHGFLEGIQWQDYFQMANTSWLRGNPLKLRKDRSRLDLRKFTFSQREVHRWNDLPAEFVTASSVKVFKNKLETHLKNLPRRSPEKPQQNAPSLLMHLYFSWCFYKLLVKTVYLIGYRDTSHCPSYIYTYNGLTKWSRNMTDESSTQIMNVSLASSNDSNLLLMTPIFLFIKYKLYIDGQL